MLLICCILGITSCSDQNETTNETTSLQVSINFSDIARQAPASDRDGNSNIPSLYNAVVKLNGDTGDIMGVKWIEKVTSDNNTVTFDSVSVGANVEIEANVYNSYNPESENSHIYNGKSGNIKVTSGTNKVTLPMKNLSISDEDTPVYTAESMKTTFNGKEYDGFQMSFYENGKFILKKDAGIISQGIWSGTSDVFTNGGTISITEYAFKDLDDKADSLSFTGVCHSAGYTKNIKITVNNETCNFSFTSVIGSFTEDGTRKDVLTFSTVSE